MFPPLSCGIRFDKHLQLQPNLRFLGFDSVGNSILHQQGAILPCGVHRQRLHGHGDPRDAVASCGSTSGPDASKVYTTDSVCHWWCVSSYNLSTKIPRTSY